MQRSPGPRQLCSAEFVLQGAIGGGRVVFGAIGDGDRLEMTVIGDAVNETAKLEKHTRAAQTPALVAAGLYDPALEQGFLPSQPVRRLPQQKVAGAPNLMDLVAL